MKRGRRVALVAHCLLNANARVEGLAGYEGVHPLVAELAERGFGIVQLPCPEVLAEGCLRDPQPREHYDTPAFRARCEAIVADAVTLVERMAEGGTKTVAYIGVEGSPTCGVSKTNVADDLAARTTVRVPGCGVLVCALRDALADRDLVFSAIDGRDPDLGVSRALRALDDA